MWQNNVRSHYQKQLASESGTVIKIDSICQSNLSLSFIIRQHCQSSIDASLKTYFTRVILRNLAITS